MSHDKSLKRAVTLIGSCMPFSVLPMHYYSLQGRQDALRVAVLNIEDLKTCQQGDNCIKTTVACYGTFILSLDNV